MTRMTTWVAVLVAGITLLIAVPQLAEAGTAGLLPKLVIPAGFFVAMIGAVGLFFAFALRDEPQRQKID